MYAFFWCGFLIFCTYCSQFTLIDIFILHPPLRTHPTTVIQDFCADAHGLTRKCCLCVVLYAPTNIRAWLNNEINAVGGCCCTHFFGVDFCTCCLELTLIGIFILTPPLRTHQTTVIQDLCADAHGLTRKCCWWVVLYAPTNNTTTHQQPPLTHQSIPTQPRIKVFSPTRIA